MIAVSSNADCHGRGAGGASEHASDGSAWTAKRVKATGAIRRLHASEGAACENNNITAGRPSTMGRPFGRLV
jgi:hypothetical protein